jgi:hypothetical protein
MFAIIAALLRFLRHGFLMLAVLAMFRITIGAIGVPESVGTWISSGTLLAMILAVYYGYSAPSHGFTRYWYFVLIGVLISVVENLMVVAGILFTTNFGIANYFSSNRVTVTRHIQNHLMSALGGMDTIPLVVLAGIGFVIGSRRRSLAVSREGVRL